MRPYDGLHRYGAYLVRIWIVGDERDEGVAAADRSRVGVEIQAVASGECTRFSDLDEALAYLRRAGLGLGDAPA